LSSAKAAYQREYRRTHPGLYAQRKAYYASHPDKAKARQRYQADYRSQHGDRLRRANVAYQRERDSGVTPDTYAALSEVSGGGCWMCDALPQTVALNADHDHVSGKPRGVLCPPCNRMLGWVERVGVGVIHAYIEAA
jgi:hypothetical protein